MIKQSVIFKYKGERNYIHGTDLIHYCLSQFNNNDIQAFTFSVNDMIFFNHGTFFICNNKTELPKDSKATGIVKTNTKCHYIAYSFPTCKPENPLSYDYNEKLIAQSSKIEDKEIYSISTNPYSFIENIIAMNKLLLSTIFPKKPGKWVFTKLMLNIFVDDIKHISIKFSTHFQERLFKSSLFYNNQEIGELYFMTMELQ